MAVFYDDPKINFYFIDMFEYGFFLLSFRHAEYGTHARGIWRDTNHH